MTPHDFARAFLDKAADDEKAARLLAANPEIPDWLVGFHCQQAIEKRLKAVLAVHEVTFTKTHNLQQLSELLETELGSIPDWMRETYDLIRFAVHLRYDYPSAHEGPIDREKVLVLTERVGQWAESEVA